MSRATCGEKVALTVEPDPGRAGRASAWTLTAPEVASSVGSDLTLGLTEDEARRRLVAEGRNELQSQNGPGALAIFAAQFRSIVIWVLIVASAVSLALGEGGDAVAIAAIVFLNALIGFYQEYRAERAVAALRRMAAPLARVVRNGHARVIPAAEVVRGDVLLLEAGDLSSLTQ